MNLKVEKIILEMLETW